MGITVIVILLVVYFGVRLAYTGYDFGYRVFTEGAVDEAPGKDVLIQIREDMSEYEIAQLFEERGLVRNARLFFLQLKLSVYSGKVVPGVYTVNTSMMPQEIMAAIAPEEETESTEDTENSENTENTSSEADTESEETDDENEFEADDDFVEE
jgi:UPF0755 protein